MHLTTGRIRGPGMVTSTLSGMGCISLDQLSGDKQPRASISGQPEPGVSRVDYVWVSGRCRDRGCSVSPRNAKMSAHPAPMQPMEALSSNGYHIGGRNPPQNLWRRCPDVEV